jgi:hypothetical protein
MSSVVSCHLMGGLGNQLFQIFATISYGMDAGRVIVFPFTQVLTTGTHRPTYWNNFLKSFLLFTTNNPTNKFTNEALYSFPVINEHGFTYNKIPHAINNPVILLHGYFQSYKYFKHNQATLFSMLKLDQWHTDIRREYFSGENAAGVNVSMHFRIGDYQDIQHVHPVLPYQYYMNAIREIRGRLGQSNIRILYFCEAPDRHIIEPFITKLKSKFEDIKFVNVDSSITDWKQMLMMSCCDHNIIANSTFSWWGAYLNRNPTKIVCYPNKWFGPALANKPTDDLFPPEWRKISYDLT